MTRFIRRCLGRRHRRDAGLDLACKALRHTVMRVL